VTTYHTGEPPDFCTGGGLDVEDGIVTSATPANEWTVGIAWEDVRRWFLHHGYRLRVIESAP
jgi:hypothetical protein